MIRPIGRNGRWTAALSMVIVMVMTACGSAITVESTTTVGPSPTTTSTVSTPVEPSESPAESPPTSPESETTQVASADARSESPWPPLEGGTQRPLDLVPEVVEIVDHDPAAFTQGLLIDDGRMFESTGRYGESALREVDPATGEVLRSIINDPAVFAEGLELVGDRLIQLTWREEVAFIWDAATFDLVDTYTYAGEGWGICFDGTRLVMSDGSDELTFRDPETFAVTGSVAVTLDGTAVTDLNELECVDGYVVANVWRTPSIVVIEPADGRVVGLVDAASLVERVRSEPGEIDVLNGIAFDELSGLFHLTGKYWPATFVVRFVER